MSGNYDVEQVAGQLLGGQVGFRRACREDWENVLPANMIVTFSMLGSLPRAESVRWQEKFDACIGRWVDAVCRPYGVVSLDDERVAYEAACKALQLQKQLARRWRAARSKALHDAGGEVQNR